LRAGLIHHLLGRLLVIGLRSVLIGLGRRLVLLDSGLHLVLLNVPGRRAISGLSALRRNLPVRPRHPLLGGIIVHYRRLGLGSLRLRRSTPRKASLLTLRVDLVRLVIGVEQIVGIPGPPRTEVTDDVIVYRVPALLA